jgi:hypothetical protein
MLCRTPVIRFQSGTRKTRLIFCHLSLLLAALSLHLMQLPTGRGGTAMRGVRDSLSCFRFYQPNKPTARLLVHILGFLDEVLEDKVP